MDPTRCAGGCGRWVHHPKRAKVARRRFCATCANPAKRLVDTQPPAQPSPEAIRARRSRRKHSVHVVAAPTGRPRKES